MKGLGIFLLCIIIIFALAFGQPPGSTSSQQTPEPCSSDRMAAERLRAEVAALQRDKVQKDLDRTSARLNEEQKKAEGLSLANAQQKEEFARQKAALVAERDEALHRIAAANGRWMCEVLKIGCVGKGK